MNATDLGAEQLGHIRILLLRHRAGSGGESFRQQDKTEFCGGEECDFFGEAAEVQPDAGKRLQILEDEIAVARRIHRVACRRSEAKLACGDGAVESERCSSHSTRTERAIVQARSAVP